MYNTRYLPESFEQYGLEKTILRQFPYNVNLRSSGCPDSRWRSKTMKGFIQNQVKSNISIKIYTTLYQYRSVIPVPFSSTLPFFAPE